jgi:hypothetical protein
MLWGIPELRVTCTVSPSMASITGLGTVRSPLKPLPKHQVRMLAPFDILCQPPILTISDAQLGPR